MNFFSNNPFVKILGFWLAGLLLAKYLPALLLAFSGWLIAGTIWYIKLLSEKKSPFDLISSTLLTTTILLLSALNYYVQHPPIPHPPNEATYFTVTLLEKPTEKTKLYQVKAIIDKCENDSLNSQHLLCWIEKSEDVSKFEIGDKLFCQGRISRIINRGNPFEFDYQSYLADQGIYFSCLLDANKLKKMGTDQRTPSIIAERFREKLLVMLRAKLKKDENFQVISALTLGYRKELSTETRDSFTKTGAMHVLAVSGLHVGLIFLFLLRVFSFLKYSSLGKWIRFSLVVVFLWSYALITGFSPSVQRATIMFTFLLVAESINRTSSIYNSIAASAFALLFINPDIIFSVGFQLSYSAVLSIVYFHPLFEKILPVENEWMKKPWQLFCVSIAAQIGTFPLSIYYFNQFPVYFWLSNFVVIPAAFVQLAGTFLFFIVTPVQPVQEIVASVLDCTNSIILCLLNRVSHLPGAVISNISISALQLTSLMALILCAVLFITYRRCKFLFYSLFLVIVFLVTGITEKLKLFNQHQLIVYKNQLHTYHFIDGRENYILCRDTGKLELFTYSNVILKLQLNAPRILLSNEKLSIRKECLLIENDICQFGADTYLLPRKKKKWMNSYPVPLTDSVINLINSKQRLFTPQSLP